MLAPGHKYCKTPKLYTGIGSFEKSKNTEFNFKMAALRCFFAIKIKLVECILCGQYILADRFLRNSGYLVEHEVFSTFRCQFPSKKSFVKSKNTEVCLNLTLKRWC